MNLVSITAICLALFFHTALAQNNTVVDSSNSTGTSNSTSGSSSSSNSTTSDSSNSTASANSTDSSSGSNTTVVSPPSNITAPENVTAAGNFSSASNATVNGTSTESNSTNSTEAGSAGDPSAGNLHTSDASTADMTMFGVSSRCAAVIQRCYAENASAEFEQLLYCEAFEEAEDCLTANTTSGTNETCTSIELTRVQVFSCAPANQNLDVAAPCKARLTQCAVDELSPAEKLRVADDGLFLNKTCATLRGDTCLRNPRHGAVCTPPEIVTIAVDSTCSAMSLLSSALLITIMVMVTKVM